MGLCLRCFAGWRCFLEVSSLGKIIDVRGQGLAQESCYRIYLTRLAVVSMAESSLETLAQSLLSSSEETSVENLPRKSTLALRTAVKRSNH